MGNLNKVMLIGKLGQDPEKRVTPGGHSVVSVSLATTEYFKDQGGNKQEKTEWHRIAFWNRLAEIVEQYCRKGSEIYVEGSLQTNEWQDKDGNKRWSTQIVARQMQMLGPKGQTGQGGFQENQQQGNQTSNASPQSQSPQSPQSQSTQSPPSAPANDFANDFVEDDIPF